MLQLIIQRATQEYGLDVGKNAKVSREFADRGIGELWHFVLVAYAIAAQQRRWDELNPLRGLLALVKLIPTQHTVCERRGPVNVYSGELRNLIINCCEWLPQLGKSGELSELCGRLIKNGEGTRAAAIAVLHLDFAKAQEAVDLCPQFKVRLA